MLHNPTLREQQVAAGDTTGTTTPIGTDITTTTAPQTATMQIEDGTAAKLKGDEEDQAAEAVLEVVVVEDQVAAAGAAAELAEVVETKRKSDDG